MDADLEARQRMINEEYRSESLRVVKSGGHFSRRLSDLLDEQDTLLDEQFRRDVRRMNLQMTAVIVLALGIVFAPLLFKVLAR